MPPYCPKFPTSLGVCPDQRVPCSSPTPHPGPLCLFSAPSELRVLGQSQTRRAGEKGTEIPPSSNGWGSGVCRAPWKCTARSGQRPGRKTSRSFLSLVDLCAGCWGMAPRRNGPPREDPCAQSQGMCLACPPCGLNLILL